MSDGKRQKEDANEPEAERKPRLRSHDLSSCPVDTQA